MRYAFHGVTLDSTMPLPELRRAGAGAPPVSLAISLIDGALDDRVEWFRRWSFPRGRAARRRPWLSFGRRADGYLLRFHDLADFRISRAGDRVGCAPIDDCPPDTLRHLLIDQVLPLVLGLRGTLVLHASAVHVDGFGAIAFAGPAGCGKSSLAAALSLRGCSIVADDSLVIAGDPRAPVAVPGYPGVRLRSDAKRHLGLGRIGGAPVAHYTAKERLDATTLAFRRAPSPLRAVFVLGRRSPARRPARVQELRPRDRLIALARFACVMDVEDRRQLSTTFSNLSALLDRVRVVRLNVKDDRRAMRRNADEVLSMLLGSLSGKNDGG